ncbi:hypothetical protein [Maridesulfovibrio sp.]|uniref:hypothetical protein n=1 Tax=Maridesulfovibrio sp. TaxID=2795000 RepID=UPI0029C9E2A7|nr:hypothetical protein [Maridesulfovibrio sp.]
MIHNKVNKLVSTGQITKARALIISVLDGDRLKDQMEIAPMWEQFPNKLFDADYGESEKLPQYAWSKPYWSRIRVELNNNFSKKQLGHVVEVMLFLREKGDKRFVPPHIDVTPKRVSVESPGKEGFIPATLKKIFGNTND